MTQESEVEATPTAEVDPAAARAQALYRRLDVVAQLLRDAPPGAGSRVLWRDASGVVHAVAVGSGVCVGRDRDCEVSLDDPSVSRRHCRISHGASGVAVEDLHSTHGTRINGRRVECSRLIDGALIQVGGACLAYFA